MGGHPFVPFPPFDDIEWLRNLEPWLPPTPLRALEAKYASWAWMAFPGGQQNFFNSRVLNPLLNPWCLGWLRKLSRDELGFYDTEPLRHTLDKHVDWKSLQAPNATRLSLGAARVCDGEVVFFDSREGPISAKHVMASGALPPAFPPIEVNGVWYFDGGVSSNTPIEALHEKICAEEAADTMVILVDLWDRKCDELPTTMDDLLWRVKSIQYGSRKKAAERVIRQHHDRMELKKKKDPQNKEPIMQLEICQLMLESDSCDPRFCFSDADFSCESFERLKKQGYEDMHHALETAEPVHNLRHPHATLYRYGTLHKHRPTDKLLRA